MSLVRDTNCRNQPNRETW